MKEEAKEGLLQAARAGGLFALSRRASRKSLRFLPITDCGRRRGISTAIACS